MRATAARADRDPTTRARLHARAHPEPTDRSKPCFWKLPNVRLRRIAPQHPCLPPRPREESLLSDFGRSSDSQARPAACLLAEAASECGSQWLGNSRPRRLVTAAGPSRIRTGVPCLPAKSKRSPRPPESWWQCIGGPAPVKQSVRREPVRSYAGRAKTQAETMTIVRPRAAQFMHAKPTAFFTQHAALSRAGKNTWRHSSRFRPAADSPLCPPGQSLCPSGNQGAAVTCKCFESRNGSTGLPQKSSWITSLGAQKPQDKNGSRLPGAPQAKEMWLDEAYVVPRCTGSRCHRL